jgi:uncharacterized protein (UPF0276 family)
MGFKLHSQGMHTHCIHMDSCDTLKNILSANQLFSLIDVKRKFINSDNHKFHQYQENMHGVQTHNISGDRQRLHR